MAKAIRNMWPSKVKVKAKCNKKLADSMTWSGKQWWRGGSQRSRVGDQAVYGPWPNSKEGEDKPRNRPIWALLDTSKAGHMPGSCGGHIRTPIPKAPGSSSQVGMGSGRSPRILNTHTPAAVPQLCPLLHHLLAMPHAASPTKGLWVCTQTPPQEYRWSGSGCKSWPNNPGMAYWIA
ncbi:hypothetical protein EDB83DRAFT_2325331 [Lactarius deliciosus]|nr:hypothetical protein EDB83DRAFT_2325331 [Lactarius deliciosus]